MLILNPWTGASVVASLEGAVNDLKCVCPAHRLLLCSVFLLSQWLHYHRFIPEDWSACSVTCGAGVQVRLVKCQVLLSFSQSVADLPIDECEGPKPVSERACYGGPCNGETAEEADLIFRGSQDFDELYDWEYEGFTECSEACGGGEFNLQFLSFPCFPHTGLWKQCT